MKTIAKILSSMALAGLMGVGAAVVTASPASAYIACNRHGDCWHTRDRHAYRPGWGVTVHDDNWRWRGRGYRWREHEGRGYWGRGGVWIRF
jgi:hypothetical protein